MKDREELRAALEEVRTYRMAYEDEQRRHQKTRQTIHDVLLLNNRLLAKLEAANNTIRELSALLEGTTLEN